MTTSMPLGNSKNVMTEPEEVRHNVIDEEQEEILARKEEHLINLAIKLHDESYMIEANEDLKEFSTSALSTLYYYLHTLLEVVKDEVNNSKNHNKKN